MSPVAKEPETYYIHDVYASKYAYSNLHISARCLIAILNELGAVRLPPSVQVNSVTFWGPDTIAILLSAPVEECKDDSDPGLLPKFSPLSMTASPVNYVAKLQDILYDPSKRLVMGVMQACINKAAKECADGPVTDNDTHDPGLGPPIGLLRVPDRV